MILNGIFILFLLLWLCIGLLGYSFYLAGLAILLSLTLYILGNKVTQKDSPICLFKQKFCLAISFWGCVGLCLYSYLHDILCFNCFIETKKTLLMTSNFSLQDIKSIYYFSPRLLTLFILLGAGVALLYIELHFKKGNKKC